MRKANKNNQRAQESGKTEMEMGWPHSKAGPQVVLQTSEMPPKNEPNEREAPEKVWKHHSGDR